MTKFIGITGKKGSGKNTFAECLANELVVIHDKSVVITGFANLLKLSAYRLLTGDMEATEEQAVAWVDERKNTHEMDFYDDEAYCEHSLTFRKFLQRYGTESHRDTFGKFFWIQAVLDNEDYENVDFVIVADVRFENEAQSIISYGEGTIVEITGRAGGDGDTHLSEQDLDPGLIGISVVNSGSMEDLRRQADRIAAQVVA